MAASQSWIEQMQQLKKQQAQGCEAEPEAKLHKEAETPGAILHWLMKAAMPEWTPKELKSSKAKLKTVGVECCSDLEDALEEKGELNQRIRDANLKTFGPSTLSRFRTVIKTHRERQRMQFLLEERRRLDLERKANPELPASSTQSTADGEEETEIPNTEDHLGINLDDCTTASGSGSGANSGSNSPGTGSPGAPVNTNAEEHHSSEEAALNTEETAEEESAEGEDEAEEEGEEEEEEETSPVLADSPAKEKPVLADLPAKEKPVLADLPAKEKRRGEEGEEEEVARAELPASSETSADLQAASEVVNPEAETAEPVSQNVTSEPSALPTTPPSAAPSLSMIEKLQASLDKSSEESDEEAREQGVLEQKPVEADSNEEEF